eukprot:6198907-Pleurochrysis_carterae.AAC.2
MGRTTGTASSHFDKQQLSEPAAANGSCSRSTARALRDFGHMLVEQAAADCNSLEREGQRLSDEAEAERKARAEQAAKEMEHQSTLAAQHYCQQ